MIPEFDYPLLDWLALHSRLVVCVHRLLLNLASKESTTINLILNGFQIDFPYLVVVFTEPGTPTLL
jgi:hypothetical protein